MTPHWPILWDPLCLRILAGKLAQIFYTQSSVAPGWNLQNFSHARGHNSIVWSLAKWSDDTFATTNEPICCAGRLEIEFILLHLSWRRTRIAMDPQWGLAKWTHQPTNQPPSQPANQPTNRRRWAQKPLHRAAFLHRYSYTEGFVHR